MTPAARVDAAIELLDTVLRETRPADQVIAHWLRGRRYVGSKDRGWIVEAVYASLREKQRLEWWAARVGLPARARSLVIVALMLIDHRTGNEMPTLFDGSTHGPSKLSDIEQMAVQMLHGQDLAVEGQPRAVRLNLPGIAADRLMARFGDRLEALGEAMNTPAPVDLRANGIKADRDEVAKQLAREGVESEPTPFSPMGLRLARRMPIFHTRAFSNGLAEVQDEGSQLVALLVDAKPGDQVADFCAGAGGKTLAMAATMANKGRIMALDISEARLERMSERMRRAGVHNIERRALKHERDPWVRRHKLKFDRVLVDAPCTGSGTWRRAPDAKWKLTEETIAELTELQGRILESAARLVKTGGRIVYATCSLLPEENEARAEAFLASHGSEFRRLDAREILPADLAAALKLDGPDLALDPATHGTDGFYAVAFERIADPAPTEVVQADAVQGEAAGG
ncbi:RsmB/NOP family class I SAM-dependent RNA methyltransferase [Tistrella mobilis]|uniref:RsmB/NOP family class I SAM-dependent RNA methyltransferase n=1 Tax=Tistrella mobilis TaxID=171437 RepID=UPI0035588D56